MRVTLFGYFLKNPYLLLYKRSLEEQGLHVELERHLGVIWLLTRGRSCDAVHLHWIETAYEPLFRSRLGQRLSRHFRVLRTLRALLRLASFLTTWYWLQLRGTPAVYTVHNFAPHEPAQNARFRGLLRRIAQRAVITSAQSIHVHSEYARQLVESGYGRTAGVVVVPHGNYVGYYPNAVSSPEARRRLNLPDDEFIFLFLGLLRPYKGLEELITAFSELELPSSRLMIVGQVTDPEYRKSLDRLVATNPAIQLIPEYVADEDLHVYLNACDVCVLPYRNITTSGASILALSFGRPVVAPAIGSFLEVIRPPAGFLYDPLQPDALAGALQRARQQVWSRDAILDYVEQFGWERLGPRLAGLYDTR